MASANIQELFEFEAPMIEGSFIKSLRHDVFSHQVSLDKPVGDPSMYRELINLLYLADENAEFNLFINSPGGCLSACMAIIEAIKETNAVVRAIITGECHSAASIIALNCHEVIVTDSAHMLVHSASYSTGGGVMTIKNHVDFSTKMINKILTKTYTGFLTPDEMNSVMSGVELWFDSDEIKARLISKNKAQEKLKNAAKTPKLKKVG